MRHGNKIRKDEGPRCGRIAYNKLGIGGALIIRMIMNKKWIVNNPPADKVNALANAAGISSLLAKVLASRGMEDPEHIKAFLNPDLERLHDPFLMNDMDIAVERIVPAVRSCEKIAVYGDFDVDGVTGTSILFSFLRSMGADAEYFIPDRFTEGYGVSMSAAERIKDGGNTLVVTVDCGTTAVEEISLMNQMGLDVIITDHHECREKLPQALAVINPCRQDSTYPFKDLAGVGVVFKLITALCKKLGKEGDQYKYLDLAALGTLADVVPLVDENRIIAKHGLEMIGCTKNKGLKALMDVANLSQKPVSSRAVSFALAPRVNSAGRMGSAGRAVELFTTDDQALALRLAEELNTENSRRQETEIEILEQAIRNIEASKQLDEAGVIVAAGENWHKGVIGIVAARITERYKKPCIIISLEDGTGKGSARSVEGFDILAALTRCKELMDAFGGHELAAGLALRADSIPEFMRRINEHASECFSADASELGLKIDTEINFKDINMDNAKQLELLAPFGAGNPPPVFACSGLKIDQMRTVGENKHLKLKLSAGKSTVDAIGFNMGGMAASVNCGDFVDAACLLEINSWNSKDIVQLNVKDLRLSSNKSEEDDYFASLDKAIDFRTLKDDNRYGAFFEHKGIKPADIVPERNEFVVVFQHIRSICADGYNIIFDLFALSRNLKYSNNISMNFFKLKRIIEIFEELDLIKTRPYGEYGIEIWLNKNIGEKRSLESSRLFLRLQNIKKQIT
ncbi:MAG: single-stranded-DNA-specific exonuclease RecJ [Clostridia bacterium]|nr:single-stranded-DNA-specific exonuclease RecJ [Clostridia bacterium]